MHFPVVEFASDFDDSGLCIDIWHDPPLEKGNNISYVLEYDRKNFEITLSCDTAASYSTPDSIHLVFNKNAPNSVLKISRAYSSIIELTLKSHEKDTKPTSQEYRVNLAQGMKRFSVSSAQFQDLQMELIHSTILDVSVSGCSFEDLLAEVLSKFRMNVVLDQQTSNSRTCWLSGRIIDESVLIVLDGQRGKDGDCVSIDVWSKLKRIDEAILENLAETHIGDVPSDFSGLDIRWAIEVSEREGASLTVAISSNREKIEHSESPIFFAVDYQGHLTESFEAHFLGQREQVSISADLRNILASWHGDLTEPYITVYLSDARWKNLERSHIIVVNWKQALEQQIKFKLSTGSRFRSISEFAKFLNMAGEGESAIRLFSDSFLNLRLNNCDTHRTADHCARAAIITGLVACFDPPRGISGYLEILTGPQSPKSLEEIGSRRTWRDHISQIAQDCSIFAPKATKLGARKNEKKPGRPPTRLIPTAHPLELYEQLLKEPISIVCKYCRFYQDEERVETRLLS
jgi:hypothetical protein